jgi:hypothetical protein
MPQLRGNEPILGLNTYIKFDLTLFSGLDIYNLIYPCQWIWDMIIFPFLIQNC